MMMVELVKAPSLSKFSWLRHGFSTRRSGRSSAYGGTTLNLGWTKEDDPANVRANRASFVDSVSSPGDAMKLVTVRQVHSNVVRAVGPEAFTCELETPEGKAVLEADGLITDAPGVLIAAGTADCVPVLVADPVHRAVGAFHAGWRGTVAGIVEKGIGMMREQYGSRPEDLIAVVGPSIGACCYTVGEEVREQFAHNFTYGADLFREEGATSSLYVDLWQANHRQLFDSGVPAKSITLIGECTGCARMPNGDRRYFSHRMEHGYAGRMLNAIGIAGE
ncbi:MAG TPA: peptidoglycan editing factor PgeF [Edaphobacter sp.]